MARKSSEKILGLALPSPRFSKHKCQNILNNRMLKFRNCYDFSMVSAQNESLTAKRINTGNKKITFCNVISKVFQKSDRVANLQ